jgi:serine/threonine protein kinase
MRHKDSIIRNRYSIIEVIGSGGMGTVYKAQDLNLNSLVAIKETVIEGNDDLSHFLIKSVESEAKILANLSNSGIPSVRDYFEEDGSYFIVMEFIDGESLSKLLREKVVFPLEKVISIGVELMNILEYLHSYGVIHKDIKPDNLKIIGETHRLVLLDFGIAKGSRFSDITTAPAFTPRFSPPEQVLNEKSNQNELRTDARSDLYSAGVTLFMLLTGELPPPADKRIYSHLSTTPDPLLQLLENIKPAQLSNLFAIAMAFKREDRFSSAKEMRAALEKLKEIPPTSVKIEIKKNNSNDDRNEIPNGEKTLAGNKHIPDWDNTQPNVAVEKEIDKIVSITILGNKSTPNDFPKINKKNESGTRFFPQDSDRYKEIKETLTFYREHLNKEYEHLSKQARLTYYLWLFCVGIGFLALIAGMILLFSGKLAEGAISAISTIIVFFIQKVFQQREDHYRELASTKNSHLEYGNQWLLVIQSIDAIEDTSEKSKQQTRLVKVLTEKLQRNTEK